MKKLLLLIAAITVFAAACSTETVLDTATTTIEEEAGSATNESDNAASSDAASSDSSGDADAPEGVDDATTEPADATPAPTVAAIEEPADADAEEPAGDDSDNSVDIAALARGVAEADDWCEAAALVEQGTGVMDTLDFTDPVSLEQGMQQSLAVIAASKRLAPSEIAADIDQSLAGLGALVAGLEAVDWSFVDLDLSLLEEFDGPMELATYNIESYNFAQCGIGTDPGLPPVLQEDGDSSDDFAFEGTVRDQAIAGLVEAGFTEAEADCLFNNLDFNNPEVMADLNGLIAVFGECGMSMDRLAQLGGG